MWAADVWGGGGDPNGAKTLGRLFWADLSGCRRNFREAEPARELALIIVRQAGLTPAGDASVTVANGEDSGATVLMIVVPLMESHLAIHTWPELDYAAVDFFTCGDPDRGRLAFMVLCAWFEARHIEQGEVERTAVLFGRGGAGD